jgi:hypothetical protein
MLSIHRISVAVAAMALSAFPSAADAQTPTISGNGWVALAIIGGFVAIIYFTVMGALHVERRDATLGRRGGHDHGWFGAVPLRDDDEDGPDIQNGSGNGN